MDQIPSPPEPRVIESKDLEKLEKWIQYFRDLSSRVRIVTPKDHFFEDTIKQVKAHADHNVGDLYKIADWPDLQDIAFFVTYDSATPGNDPVYKPGNSYIFCFSDYAFGIKYHSFDGDHEVASDCKTYSLASMKRTALLWSYITKLITERVEELSNVVPEKLPE